jgi:multidrug efflux pump subunit AcrA (membrane-fusion protein)
VSDLREIRCTGLRAVLQKICICLILIPLLPLASCKSKAVVAADQPVPVRLRIANHVQQPDSVAVSGSVEANISALTAFQIGGRVAKVYVEEPTTAMPTTARAVRPMRPRLRP